jgi:outer membrane receptor for ferrienterochelin and colicin
VSAQDNDEEEELALIYGNESTASIATGNLQSLRRAPAVAGVITAEDIAAIGATELDQVLETVPGVHVSPPVNYEPLYPIRGIHGGTNPHMLMLLNGVPMSTMLTGSRGSIWGGYPVEHIARIEVIRGPGSALYGADAYSGVINKAMIQHSLRHHAPAGVALRELPWFNYRTPLWAAWHRVNLRPPVAAFRATPLEGVALAALPAM